MKKINNWINGMCRTKIGLLLFFSLILNAFSSDALIANKTRLNNTLEHNTYIGLQYKPFTLNNSHLLDKTNNRAISYLNTEGMVKRASPFQQRTFFREYRAHLIFAGILIGTSITTLILNNKVQDACDEEEAAFSRYTQAGKQSDFTTLWQDVTDARDKTDTLVGFRGGFGIASGAIGLALLFSLRLDI